MTKKVIKLLLLVVLTTSNCFSQDLSDNAKKYFGNYMNSKKFYDMLVTSFPNQENVKLVLKDSSAFKYFDWLIANKSKMLKKSDSAIVYEDIRIESFTTEDVLSDKKNYAGGMSKIKDFLKPAVIFYEVNYLKKKGDQFGMAFKFFVNINGNWLIFPKPWQAFDTPKYQAK